MWQSAVIGYCSESIGNNAESGEVSLSLDNGVDRQQKPRPAGTGKSRASGMPVELTTAFLSEFCGFHANLAAVLASRALRGL